MPTVYITEPNYQKCQLDNNPISPTIIFNNKLFNSDICDYDGKISNVQSNRTNFLIGGVLKLTSNTYYKDVKTNKYQYEFKPLNWKYPKFFVPSEIKNNLIKNKQPVTDYFVVIKFKEWNDKFPTGTIQKCIGSINDQNNKYESLFYYYPNHPYLPPIKDVSFDVSLIDYNINPIDAISIDPIGCKDIDDALSYNFETNTIGIHIADVNHTIKNMNYNKFSTIYAPHKTLNLIPDELSNNYCSLLERNTRPVISLYINIEKDEMFIKREFIVVKKNLSYDYAEEVLQNDNNELYPLIKKLFDNSLIINTKNNYVTLPDNIKFTTHEMVQVYMVLMNTKLAEYLKDDNIIFRNQKLGSFASYSYQQSGHEFMNLTYYGHFTSPIRRLVDQYNHIILINKLFQKTEIQKLDLETINQYERDLKKIYLMWDYIKVADLIKNGNTYKLKFIKFDVNNIEFKLLDYNITIRNKIILSICDKNKIKINENIYEINGEYNLPIYCIKNIKNNFFPKIIIKFI